VTVGSPPAATPLGAVRRDGRLVGLQIGYEQRSYWRNPAAALFTFALPLMFLFIFGSISGTGSIHVLPGVRFEQYYVPSILAYGVIAACFSNLAITMTFRREQGILKRVRGTPLPAAVYLGGAVGNAMAVALILTAITLLAGVTLYAVPIPRELAAVIVAVLVGAASFCALGLAVSTVVPNADAAPAIVNIVMLGLLFISGTFFPVDPQSTLAHIANVFPVSHLVKALLDAVLPRPGHPVWAWSDLAVIAAWGGGGLLFALRHWRWEPSRR